MTLTDYVPRVASFFMLKNKRLFFLLVVLALVAAIFFSTERYRLRGSQDRPPMTTGRVTLVQLMSELCPSCRLMEPVLAAVGGKYAAGVDVIVKDVFARPGISRDYGITTIPAHFFYDGQGRERHRHEGVMSEQEMAAVLDELVREQAAGVGAR